MVIICMRLQDNEGMNQRVQMEVDDPRRFSVHLAPIPIIIVHWTICNAHYPDLGTFPL
jgi:hypothetical protein